MSFSQAGKPIIKRKVKKVNKPAISPDVTAFIDGQTHLSSRPPAVRVVPKAEPPKETITAIATQLLNKALAMDAEKVRAITKRTTGTVVPLKAVYKAFQEFEKVVGGRQKLMETLQQCPETSVGYNLLAKLVADPDFAAVAHNENTGEENLRYALGVLAQRHKLSLGALVGMFRDAKSSEMAINAMIQVSEHAPKLVAQTIEDATNRFEDCQSCMGQGRRKRMGDNGEWALDEYGQVITHLCYNCNGEGKVWTKHDFQNRKTALELAGILKPKALVENSIDNRKIQVGSGDFTPGSGGFEKLMKAVDSIINVRSIKVDDDEATIESEYVVYDPPSATEPTPKE